MKPARTRSTESLSARFAAYRRSLRFGAVAVLSMSTVRAINAVESRDRRQINRLVQSIVQAGRTDDTIADDETIGAVSRIELTGDVAPHGHAATGYLLSASDRAALTAAMGRLPRSLVLRSAPAVEVDEPLPSGYVAPAVEDYIPLSPAYDAEIEAQAARDAAVEIAAIEAQEAIDAAMARRDSDAVSFRSDWQDHPMDTDRFAPAMVRHANRVTVQANAATLRDPVSEHAKLLALVLARPLRAKR